MSEKYSKRSGNNNYHTIPKKERVIVLSFFQVKISSPSVLSFFSAKLI